MIAIAMQCFVLQTHVHAAAPAEEASLSAHHHDAADGIGPCAICRLGAAARDVLAPPPALITPPQQLAQTQARISADRSVRLTPAPPWRSRAPPIALS
ncbi:MAG TPA: hypothetical protein PLS69_01475 [Terricaulis sp.]|nr:hypothetical protein [Terricaulis sp.]